MTRQRQTVGEHKVRPYGIARLSAVIVILATIFCLTSANAELTGYLKSFSIITRSAGESDAPADGLVLNRLRFRYVWNATDAVKFEAAYALMPRVGNATFGGAELPKRVYRVSDPQSRLYPPPDDPVGSFTLEQDVDRAFASINLPFVDMLVGRQPVAFGSARMVNPTDALAPFVYDALDKEERVGVDAVRVRKPLGAFSEVDGGIVFGDGFESSESAGFLRVALNPVNTNLSLIIMRFRENMLVGVDAARSVGGASVWLESAQVFAKVDGDDYFRLSVGADYKLLDRLYGGLEYHFNGAGASGTACYPCLAETTAYKEGGVYFVGRQYFAPFFGYEITPLLSGSLQILANPSDGSAYLAPHIEYSFQQDVALDAGAFVGFGKSDAEFSRYGDTVFTSIRLYF